MPYEFFFKALTLQTILIGVILPPGLRKEDELALDQNEVNLGHLRSRRLPTIA